MKKLIITLLISLFITGCTKTEDYLRDMVIKHSDLIDPGSAMFRNITSSDNRKIWCSEINVKNGMGGYVGWKPFEIKVIEDGTVFVAILTPTHIPLNATSEYKKGLEDGDKYLARRYHSDCENTKPVRNWIPFWEAKS
jgi:hypothetical protein